MGQVLKFPGNIYAPVQVASGSVHDVWVRVVDQVAPEEARWHLQFAMQRAASFKCLGGFTDKAARRHRWHNFDIGKTYLTRRFLREIESLVREGRVRIEVDGAQVKPIKRDVA